VLSQSRNLPDFDGKIDSPSGNRAIEVLRYAYSSSTPRDVATGTTTLSNIQPCTRKCMSYEGQEYTPCHQAEAILFTYVKSLKLGNILYLI
jgi:hypothetical protein